MALFDNKLDWYDWLVPGSTLTYGPSILGNWQNFGTDLADKIGFGTQRRQQEFNASEAEKEREFNSAEAQKQRDYETQMSNTSYQRAAEDIKAAGLNPSMLLGAGGTPAPTPTASSASAGSGARSGIQSSMNVLSGITGLLNSVTNARALDHKINGGAHVVTNQIYNNVGQLMKSIVKTIV